MMQSKPISINYDTFSQSQSCIKCVCFLQWMFWFGISYSLCHKPPERGVKTLHTQMLAFTHSEIECRKPPERGVKTLHRYNQGACQ